jgi:butyrate kinase
VVTDELDPVARLSGHPDLPRRTTFHALSQKAVGRRIAARLGKSYDRCRLVIAHVGGGITIGAHRRGRVVEVNNALEGEGPFSPERTGSLPLIPFLKLALERGWSPEQADEWTVRQGGLIAYLATNDCRRIEQLIAEGDKDAALVYNAMTYQIALAIGSCAVAVGGRVDAIGLTGGVSRSKYLVNRIRRQVRWIAPVYVYPTMEEMRALAEGVLAVLEGHEIARVY